MDAESIRAGGREFLVVGGVAMAGLTLAAVTAFTPWYAQDDGATAVVEVRGPAAPASQAEGR